jgi:hypothetical protein
MLITLATIVAALATWLQSPTNTFPVIWDEPMGIVTLVGDDNRDGYVDEDESGWICHTMGNRICG